MNCITVKQKLNEAKLKGLSYVYVDHLEVWEIQDLKECGYFITFEIGKYKISEI